MRPADGYHLQLNLFSLNGPVASDSQHARSGSLGEYLEAIFHITADRKVSLVRDVALFLEVGDSSVTKALSTLSKKGLINHRRYSYVTLTAAGRVPPGMWLVVTKR